MAVTTNTMALCAVNSYPTSCSVTTNLSPVTTATFSAQETTSQYQTAIQKEESIWYLIQVAGNAITLTLSETVTIGAETLAMVRNKVRTASNTITVSESPTRVAGKARALATQTVGPISESLARVKGAVKAISQSITVSESLSRITGKARAISQSITVSESLARIKNVLRSLSATVGPISDAVAIQKGHLRTAADTIGISDAVTIARAKIRTVSQSIAVSETLSRIAAKSRALATETVGPISDAVVRVKGIPRSIAGQTITISESLARLLGKTRAISQSVGVSESLTRVAAKFRAISEPAISVSDSVARVVARQVTKTLSETVAIGAGTVARMAGKTRAISQTVGISEALARLAAKKRALSETVAVSSDAVARAKGIARTIATQTVTIGAGTVTRLSGKIRTIAQTVGVSDALAILRKKTRTIADTIAVSDAVTRALKAKNVAKTISETAIHVADAVAQLVAKGAGAIPPTGGILGGRYLPRIRPHKRPTTRQLRQQAIYPPPRRIEQPEELARPPKMVSRGLQEAVHVADVAVEYELVRGPESLQRIKDEIAEAQEQIRFKQLRDTPPARHIVRGISETVTVVDFVQQKLTLGQLSLELIRLRKLQDAKDRLQASAASVKAMLTTRKGEKLQKLKRLMGLQSLLDLVDRIDA